MLPSRKPWLRALPKLRTLRPMANSGQWPRSWIGGVTDGGPAAQGGLKAGDLIVDLAGKTVKNLNTYMVIMAQQQSGQVLEVLRSLPDDYRLPLTMRYIGGADYETIGKQLGLSNGSLRGLLNRGMSKLRQKMMSDE